MKRDVPEPWASAMLKAGIVDPRYGRPSWRQLARKVDVHPSTITAMVDSERSTDVETIAAVARELRVPIATITGWIGETRKVGDLYDPPAESRFLSKGEKDALTTLIKQIVAAKSAGSDVVQLDARRSNQPAKKAARKTTDPRKK